MILFVSRKTVSIELVGTVALCTQAQGNWSAPILILSTPETGCLDKLVTMKCLILFYLRGRFDLFWQRSIVQHRISTLLHTRSSPALRCCLRLVGLRWPDSDVSSPRSRRVVRFVLSSWSSLALLDCVHRVRSSLRLVVGLVVGCWFGTIESSFFQIGWCSVRSCTPNIRALRSDAHAPSHTQGLHTHLHPHPAPPAHNRIYTHILLEPCQSDPALRRLPGSLHHRGVTRGPPL